MVREDSCAPGDEKIFQMVDVSDKILNGLAII
jgi:hypothetical protein